MGQGSKGVPLEKSSLIVRLYVYLPVYLWKDKMKREEKDIFGELLRVLAKRQEEDQDMGVEDEVGIFCFV